MCVFITTVLPAGTNEDRAKEVYARFEFGFWIQKVAPPSIPPDDLYVMPFAGECDCGTALGSVRYRPIKADPHIQIPNLKKKGWSEAKIQRWLAAKLSHPDRGIARRDEELAVWLTFIKTIIESRIADRFGVFVHFYNEASDADIIQHVERVPLHGLTPELLREMKDDTLYEFVPDPVRRTRQSTRL